MTVVLAKLLYASKFSKSKRFEIRNLKNFEISNRKVLKSKTFDCHILKVLKSES